MKKIIHLSDLHIGHEDPDLSHFPTTVRDMNERFRLVTDNIIFAKEPADDYVIVITGDLVERASNADYARARAHIDKLEAAGFTVLLVPGNHDYGTGWLGDRKWIKRFKQRFFADTDQEYPKLDFDSDAHDIAFIGLDSMAEQLDWHDALFANGELGEDQLDDLDELLARDDIKRCAQRVVYLHHHPFDPLYRGHQLDDSDQLGQVLQRHGNVDALLYGHNHHGKKRNGKWGIPRCYDAGSSTRKLGAAGEHRVIDLTRTARLDYDGDFHGVY